MSSSFDRKILKFYVSDFKALNIDILGCSSFVCLAMKFRNRLDDYRIKTVNFFGCLSIILRCELLSMCKNELSLLFHWRNGSGPSFSHA